ncbi:hypothetical protein C8J57DRAFT_1524129 [Mycena rebaudengoi]|nr:hypothetical protein C8J57DRAFT_1524129 [Mycena rebaudengoi]
MVTRSQIRSDGRALCYDGRALSGPFSEFLPNPIPPSIAPPTDHTIHLLVEDSKETSVCHCLPFSVPPGKIRGPVAVQLIFCSCSAYASVGNSIWFWDDAHM